MTEQVEVTKTRIEIPTDNYQKTRSANGSISRHNGDVVAAALAGLTLDEVYSLASEVVSTEAKPFTVADLNAKYEHLNAGQQRMNLGNRIRGAVNKMNKAEEGSGDTYLTTMAEPLRDAVEAREQEATAAKATKQAEREAAAAEKAAKKESAKAETNSSDEEE